MSIIETATTSQRLLDVKDLRVTFKTPDGDVTAVNDLNFSLRAGETLGSSASPVRVNRKRRLP